MGRVVGNHQVDEVRSGIVDDLMGESRSAKVAVSSLEVDGFLIRSHGGRAGHGVVQLPQRPVSVEGEVFLAWL